MALRKGDWKLLVNVPNSTWFNPPELGGRCDDQENVPGERIPLALYNITADPTERVDLSGKFPDVVKEMQKRLEEFRETAVPPGNKPNDPAATKAAERTGAWGPWR